MRESFQVPLSTRLRLGGRDVYTESAIHQEGPERPADPGSSLFYGKMLSDGTSKREFSCRKLPKDVHVYIVRDLHPNTCSQQLLPLPAMA